MLETSDHLLQMKHATKVLTLKNGYGRYFMLSHYTVIFKMAYRQKVGELQFRSRMQNANIIRPALQSYFLYEEREEGKVYRSSYASRGQ